VIWWLWKWLWMSLDSLVVWFTWWFKWFDHVPWRSLMLLIRRGQGLGWQRGSNVRSSAFHFQRYCKITIDIHRLRKITRS
jgi:hypothetical protein